MHGIAPDRCARCRLRRQGLRGGNGGCGGRVDHLRFTELPAADFVACMTKLLSTQRCGAGNFVDNDTYTLSLCP